MIELVLLLANKKDFGILSSFTYETNYTFTDKLVQYTSFFFCFKKRGTLFNQTNYIKIDFIENIIYIYNPINNKPYYCAAVLEETIIKEETTQWIKQFGRI